MRGARYLVDGRPAWGRVAGLAAAAVGFRLNGAVVAA